MVWGVDPHLERIKATHDRNHAAKRFGFDEVEFPCTYDTEHCQGCFDKRHIAYATTRWKRLVNGPHLGFVIKHVENLLLPPFYGISAIFVRARSSIYIHTSPIIGSI